MPIRQLILMFGCFVSLILCGCSNKAVELHPVSGTITRDGTAVTQGGIYFQPEKPLGDGMTCQGIFTEDGRFIGQTIKTNAAGVSETLNGLPIGTYTIIYHPLSAGDKMGLDETIEEKIRVEAKDNVLTLKLPAKKSPPKNIQRDDGPDAPPVQNKD